MIEPSEDSFETMMERKNPSSKQMESSEGSSNTTMEIDGGAQEAAGLAQGPAQEMGELPIDLLQDMEEPSSGRHSEIKDPPNDLLQDLEESCKASRQEVGDPIGEAPGEMEEASVNEGELDEEDDDTDLSEDDEEEEEEPGELELRGRVSSFTSMYFWMQDLKEQQKIAIEILMKAIRMGRVPDPQIFSGDRRDYPEFFVHCHMIIQGYPRKFRNDRRRVRFIIRHLSDTALEWAQNLKRQRSPLLTNYPAFMEAMTNTFHYKEELRVAEDTMLNITQGDRAAIDYINEFRELVPTLCWPDEVLQAHLCLGLNEEIRQYLFQLPQPDSLDSLMALVLQIEENLAERKAMLRMRPETHSRSPPGEAKKDSPAPEKWPVSSWLTYEIQPDIDRRHVFLLLMVRVNPYHSVAVQALVDSGASSNFMDERFAQEHYVELFEKPYPQSIHTMDGSLIGNEPVWLHTEPLVCFHQNHHELIEFDIVPSPNFSVVLGINWLRVHSPDIDWARGRCTFHSPYCLKNCFSPLPPSTTLERHAISLLPGLLPQYSDLADVFNPKKADDETSDQPSSDGSDDLSESEPSELQQAGDSDHSNTADTCPSVAPPEPVGAGVQEAAKLGNEEEELQEDRQIIPELFQQLHGATWFTRLELRGIIVEEGKKKEAEELWKVAFGLELQKKESYQPFEICSDPLIPQSVMHCILKDMLGKFVLSYGNEVVIYSMSQEAHLRHIRQVLVRFRRHHVYCSLDRSLFHQHTVEFMGFVLTPRGVRLNKSVVKTIRDYPIPLSKESLQNLMELMSPYCHFVERFAGITEPLRRQLLTTNQFHWGDEEQEAFESVKRAFRKAPLLHHPKCHKQFYLDTGVNMTALYASLIQVDEQSGKRVFCAFFSRDLSPTEANSPPLMMKTIAIKAALDVWSCYLESTEEPIMILLNTEDLASLNNDRLTVILPGQWAKFFGRFHCDVMERPEQDGSSSLPLQNPNHGPLRAHIATRTHTSTRTHTVTRTRTATRARTVTRARTDTRARTVIRAQADTRAHTATQTHTVTWAHADTRAHTATQTHTVTRAHTATQAHADTRAHTATQTHTVTRAHTATQAHASTQAHTETRANNAVRARNDTRARTDTRANNAIRARTDTQARTDTRARTDTWSQSPVTTERSLRDQLPELGEQKENEHAPPQEEPSRRTQQQEALTPVQLDQILSNLLENLNMDQMRSLFLHFFRDLHISKDALAPIAMLAILKMKQHLPLLPAPTLEVALLPATRSLRLILDSSLLTDRGIAMATTQLLTQMPPLVGTVIIRTEEQAEQRALMPRGPRGPRVLHLPPEFWMMLCERFCVRVAPRERPQPLRHGSHYLELHVIGSDVVLREALQDDLQRYRQCGLHDGLQDTSQDAQADDDVQEDGAQGVQVKEANVRGDKEKGDQMQEAAAADSSSTPPAPPRASGGILDFLYRQLFGDQDQPNLPHQDPAARSLAHFLAMICAEDPVPLRGRQARGGARLEELPEDDEDLDHD